MFDSAVGNSSQSYAAQLAMAKGLGDAFEFELFRLNALWQEFTKAKSNAQLEAALEAAIRFEIRLVEKIQQAADKLPMHEPEPIALAQSGQGVKPFWSKILKR